MKLILLHLLLAVFLTIGVNAEPVDTVQSATGISIESSVDRAEIFIGDLITYKLSIVYDSSIELTPPPIGANLGAFDVKDYAFDDEERLDDGTIRIESSFRLTTFTTGDYIIPPIPIEFTTADSVRRILISEPMPIKVKSLLAEGADTIQINDIKSPILFDEKIPDIYLIAGGLLVLIIAALVYGWWRRKNRPAEEAPVDNRSPWEIAFEKLAFLKEDNYPSSGEYKRYYIELSDIIRDYLERIYKIPVTDMTTYEFLSTVKEKNVDEDLYTRFKKFLDFADLVKFAKFEPDMTRMEDDYMEAWQIVEDVRRSKPLIVLTEPIDTETDPVVNDDVVSNGDSISVEKEVKEEIEKEDEEGTKNDV